MLSGTIDRALRYFLCIAELGSLSKASEVLGQTQSGLSKQLAALEAKVGVALFVRTGRGVELTEVGARLYSALKSPFRAIDQALETVSQQVATHGTVRLATVHTLSYYYAADVVAKFVSSRPHANLSLLGRSSPEVVELVNSGKADLGFVYDVAVDVGTLRSQPLFEDRMSLIVRQSNPLADSAAASPDDLKLIGFPPHYALRRMLHSAGLNASYVAEAETIDAMLKLVSSGIGNCVLPSRIPGKLLEDYELRSVPITDPPLSRWVVVITPADKPMSGLTNEFLRCSLEVAKGLET
ncbi:LysR family transcriptional regulator [Luteimonas sp. RC10]|jgi:DNA-binding transcriptional LysR family regulator|uniref:LysR family transcriptional regulator n=1 Tax=Luteimonas sp. RC10 TaxID=2587035 RepID=UPI001610AF33|nr:LysR family transcriptional regulator [Luteimonas sp. RC10]MBB3342424.1 DNA-binding transcriptional LysR family regulator [Luteimonas sp. RC10]